MDVWTKRRGAETPIGPGPVLTVGLLLVGWCVRGAVGDAIKEATRDGAPPIDLVDSDQLADKLKELGLGIKTVVVEKVSVDEDWFRQI